MEIIINNISYKYIDLYVDDSIYQKEQVGMDVSFTALNNFTRKKFEGEVCIETSKDLTKVEIIDYISNLVKG